MSPFVSSWTEFFNKTSMQSFRSFVLTIAATIVVVWFSSLGGRLLLYDMAEDARLNPDAAIRAAAQTTESSHHNYGMQVVTAVLTFLGVALGVNVVGQGVDRFSSKELHEARERANLTAADAAAARANTTKERPAVHADRVETVTVEGGG